MERTYTYRKKDASATGKYTVAGILSMLVFFLLTPYSLPFTVVAFAAEEGKTVITSDKVEYNATTRQYHLTGSVTATRDGTVLKADDVIYDEKTSEVKASGNVRYSDPENSIIAGRADINMDTKSGTISDGELVHKKNNYRFWGKTIEKKGDNEYYSPDARLTTCDGPVPDWCFRGKEIKAVVGDKVTSRDTSFMIRDRTVFHTPYLWAPLNSERQTGFLIPVPGYSRQEGATLHVPFYWAIAENRDATFVMDYFGKRGFGQGLEYRYLNPGGIKGSWWGYHIRDTKLDREFLEYRGLHQDMDNENIKGFLNLNFVNQYDYYREFNLYARDVRIQRFVESTGEINLPWKNSRLYLLSQYWVDLQFKTGNAPQKLPEAGYVLNYSKIGDIMFSASAAAANVVREHGTSAERIDVYPRLLHRFGTDVTVSQMVGFRETAYSFYKQQEKDKDLGDNAQRSFFEYDAIAHSRIFRTFPLFTHVIEPSIRYHFIDASGSPVPVFDSTELFGKTSVVELGILNRAIIKGSEAMTLRLTQGLDTYQSSRPFLPVRLEAGLRKPLSLLLDGSYDYYDGKIETLRSDIGVKLFNVNFSFGQRYGRKENIHVYTAGAEFSPAKDVNISSVVWYDAAGAGLRDVNVTVKLKRQCWNMTVEAIKRPGDFAVKVALELVGINSHTASKQEPLLTH